MKLADSCLWIELLHDAATGRQYRSRFDEPDRIPVPTLVQFELQRWVLRERDEDQANRIVAATRNCRIVPLDEPIALHAAALALQCRLAAADASIYATAFGRDAFRDAPPASSLH